MSPISITAKDVQHFNKVVITIIMYWGNNSKTAKTERKRGFEGEAPRKNLLATSFRCWKM